MTTLPPANSTASRLVPGLVSALAVVIAAVLILPFRSGSSPRLWPLLIAAALMGGLAVRSVAYALEATTVLVVWLLGGWLGGLPAVILVLSAVATMLMAAAAASGLRCAVGLPLPLCAAWLVAAHPSGLPAGLGAFGWIVLGLTALQLTHFTWGLFRRPFTPPRRIDVILASFSTNTAHYALDFMAGAKRGGASVTVHRFHHYRAFAADLRGDALALAFPVFGWKPPWPLFAWLIWKLPRGQGRPAFILYTAAGGPENAGPLVWLTLVLKGWRPQGRAWAVYPINVPTVRLGPARLWRFLDHLYPFSSDGRLASRCGEAFARGKRAGLPLLIWAFPLAVVGVLLDNKIVNIFPYRNRARRRRCNGCGLCARFCPVGRLTMVDGRPRARGTCALCLGCVNLCPTRAMQLVAWTEYGQAYRPPWPRLLAGKQGGETLPARQAIPSERGSAGR